MPDFLTRRHNTWHFVRRVPIEYAQLDPRKIIKHSTKIRVTDDRTGRRATRVALKLNEELEAQWRAMVEGKSATRLHSFEDAKRRARAMGLDYIELPDIARLPYEQQVDRVSISVRNGGHNDVAVRTAVLGTEKRPVPMLSEVFTEFEAITRDEVKDLSPDQLRIWKNGRKRAVKRFVDLVGDKPITELSDDDAIAYADDWRERVIAGETLPKTANKDIGQLSRMLKDISTRRRLKIPDLFQGQRLRGEADRSRLPFDNDFIQKKLLGKGVLDGLNDEARDVLYVMIETGLRPSEVVNLRETTIHLSAKIPYVSIEPDGRRLKAVQSKREIPLVGIALATLRRRPHGFPRYRDRGSELSSALNKFLKENDLKPSDLHTVYSLRHSFKDRLISVEAHDSMIDNLMGHKSHGPKYGKGPALELKVKFLERIAFPLPSWM